MRSVSGYYETYFEEHPPWAADPVVHAASEMLNAGV